VPDTPTTRLALYKSASDGSEDVDYTQDIGDNLDKIDLAVGALACTSSTRPSVPWNGQLIRETDTDRLWVSNGTSPASGSWSEIATPGTTQLFTDGIGSVAASASTNAIAAYVTGDTANRFTIGGDGSLGWGSGSASTDTNLYRSAANVLKTDDSLTVGTNLTVAGSASINGTLAASGGITGPGGLPYRTAQAGTASVTFTSQTSFTTTVTFPTAFPSGVTPAVLTSIASGSGTVTRWGSRAISITNTGFTLFVFQGQTSDPSQSWSAIPVSWIAMSP
jgi:hypothetical protein